MERELIYLLYDLCAKWGFCIPHEDFEQIIKIEYYNADDFAIHVVEAEGLDASPEATWVLRIAERFKERFGTDEIDSSTFIDRVRGIKENW
ncbi:hypothetical protein [Lacinutrix himadriensis]|uniref:hypothetical protein n=1 Tax=Lacinutrix himadriensis TaxID=641549 RepID=UPI00128F1088|nr:hypothetical protein [Lacinutrix himadriensis]